MRKVVVKYNFVGEKRYRRQNVWATIGCRVNIQMRRLRNYNEHFFLVYIIIDLKPLCFLGNSEGVG